MNYRVVLDLENICMRNVLYLNFYRIIKVESFGRFRRY
jgi:hypothetical protein